MAIHSLQDLTSREAELLVLGIQCLRGGEAKIDYAKLASAAGMKNTKSASDAWCRIKKKLGLSGAAREDDGSSAASPAASKKASGDRMAKRAADAAQADNEADDENSAPPKKKARGKGKAVKSEPVESEDGAEQKEV